MTVKNHSAKMRDQGSTVFKRKTNGKIFIHNDRRSHLRAGGREKS